MGSNNYSCAPFAPSVWLAKQLAAPSDALGAHRRQRTKAQCKSYSMEWKERASEREAIFHFHLFSFSRSISSELASNLAAGTNCTSSARGEERICSPTKRLVALRIEVENCHSISQQMHCFYASNSYTCHRSASLAKSDLRGYFYPASLAWQTVASRSGIDCPTGWPALRNAKGWPRANAIKRTDEFWLSASERARRRAWGK